MRTSPHFQLAAFSIVILLGLAGCSGRAPVQADFSDAWGIVEVPRGAPIQIAVVVDPFAPGGQDSMRAASLAVADYGRIYRTDVEIIPIEASCSVNGGETAAGGIVGRSNVAAVIGLSCSEACIGALPALDSNHYSVVSPTCGADQLTDQLTHFGTFLRTTWANTDEAQIAAKFAFYELAARRAVIVQSNEIDSSDFTSAFEATFSSLGGTILTIETMSDGSGSDIISRISDFDYDLIYAPIQADLAIELATELQRSEGAPIPLVGVRHIWNHQFIDDAGSASNLVYATGSTIDLSTAGEDVRDRFANAYGEEPTGVTYLFAYDATWMVLNALENSTVADGNGIQFGRNLLNEQLYDTTSHEGVSGDITCSQWGDCGRTTIGVGQVRDGEWSIVYVP